VLLIALRRTANVTYLVGPHVREIDDVLLADHRYRPLTLERENCESF